MRLIDICNGDPAYGEYVDDFLRDLPEPRLWKAFITGNGYVYSADDDWHIQSRCDWVANPTDGEEHYCLAIERYQGTNTYVFLDR